MALDRIYLSSTFKDLEPFRAAVAKSLRRAGKQVIGMEDYAAADDRQLDRCLQDVDAAHVYVGIFAYRYGSVPLEGNPDEKSITELEYRRAKGKKPCLIFLVNEDVPWWNKFNDKWTGDNEQGALIEALKKELELTKSVDYFYSEVDLAARVMAAMMKLENSPPAASAAPPNTGPENRRITHDLLVGYAASDELQVTSLMKELLPDPGALNSLLTARALFAQTEEDFLRLDGESQVCDIAVAALSDTTLAQMDMNADRVVQALEIMRARTGSLIALCLTASAAHGAAKWNFDQVIDVSAYPGAGIGLIQQVKATLGVLRMPATMPVIGVPLVVAAMKKSEAEDLRDHPGQVGEELGFKAQRNFEDVKQALGEDLVSRYGSTREDYRLPASQPSITDLTRQAIERLARAKHQRLHGRAIKLQRYPFEALVSGPPELRAIYREMSDAGCILVVDELSLFHPGVRKALAQSPMVISPRTAIVTVSAFPAYSQAGAQILRDELKAQLHGVFDRFASDCDPQCELTIGDEFGMRRWLHRTFPETVQVLRTPQVVQERLTLLAQELNVPDQPSIGGHMYSKGGGLL